MKRLYTASLLLPKLSLNRRAWFYDAVMPSIDAGVVANSVGQDKTAPTGAVLSWPALFTQM